MVNSAQTTSAEDFGLTKKKLGLSQHTSTSSATAWLGMLQQVVVQPLICLDLALLGVADVLFVLHLVEL